MRKPGKKNVPASNPKITKNRRRIRNHLRSMQSKASAHFDSLVEFAQYFSINQQRENLGRAPTGKYFARRWLRTRHQADQRIAPQANAFPQVLQQTFVT